MCAHSDGSFSWTYKYTKLSNPKFKADMKNQSIKAPVPTVASSIKGLLEMLCLLSRNTIIESKQLKCHPSTSLFSLTTQEKFTQQRQHHSFIMRSPWWATLSFNHGIWVKLQKQKIRISFFLDKKWKEKDCKMEKEEHPAASVWQ